MNELDVKSIFDTHIDFNGNVLIAIDDKIQFHKSISSKSSNVPSLTLDTPFWISSISKQFTAMVVVMLAEEGKFTLYQKIADFITDVPDDKQSITFHHLLTHTSGLSDNYSADGLNDRNSALKKILSEPLGMPTGEKYQYSSDGYTLLAILIELITGQTYETTLHEKIFKPTQMSDSGCWADDDSPIPDTTHTLQWSDWGFKGQTGIYSTTTDLFRWHTALRDSRLLPFHKNQLIFTPHIRISDTRSYGYGWNIANTERGTTVLFHNGGDDLFDHYCFFYRYIEEKVTLIMLAECAESVAVACFKDIRDYVLEENNPSKV